MNAIYLVHTDPTIPVHWIDHYAEVMLLGGGLFILLMLAVWVYLKEQERHTSSQRSRQ